MRNLMRGLGRFTVKFVFYNAVGILLICIIDLCLGGIILALAFPKEAFLVIGLLLIVWELNNIRRSIETAGAAAGPLRSRE